MMRKIRKQWDCKRHNSLIEKTGEYAKVAKAAIKKMKRAEEDYRSLLV